MHAFPTVFCHSLYYCNRIKVCKKTQGLQLSISSKTLKIWRCRHACLSPPCFSLFPLHNKNKLCNHPKLLVEGSAGKDRDSGLAEVASFLPTISSNPGGVPGGGGMFGTGRRGGGGVQKGVFPEWSGWVYLYFVRPVALGSRSSFQRII